jgi:hypothetical protein
LRRFPPCLKARDGHGRLVLSSHCCEALRFPELRGATRANPPLPVELS